MITLSRYSQYVPVVLAVASILIPLNAMSERPGRASQPPAGRIGLEHARVLRASPSQPTEQTGSRVAPKPSLLGRAARGEVIADVPPAPLDRPLVDRGQTERGVQVIQAGYLDNAGCDHCGPVCGCESPTCGIEEVYVDAGCGVETGCGVEIGCGLETGIGPACGLEGCASCDTFGPACGSEVGFGGCDGSPGCGSDACGPTSIPVFLPILRINWCRFDFFAGVQGFTGPMNFVDGPSGNSSFSDGSGSFGFYEGFNEGRSLRRWFGSDLAAQFGLRATQSNLRGAEFTSETRNQVFVTGGLFRRVDYGLQYGAVIDYLNDDWYFQGDLVQIRGEISWQTGTCHAFGLRYFAGLNDDSSQTSLRDDLGASVTGTVDFEPVDQYRLFYRRLLAGSGEWNGFVGGTDDSEFLMGAGMNLPLRDRLVLSTGATYVVGDGSVDQHRREAWNISLGLVYRPGGPTGCGRYCRPLFNVADNGSFLVGKK